MNNAVKPNAAPVECPSANPLVAVVLPPETPVSTVLRAARDLISVPERWTKWGYGFLVKPEIEEDAVNMPSAKLSEATCFCALGAVGAVLGNERGARAHGQATDMLAPALPGGRYAVALYNDEASTTHADVLRMFNRAIKKAEEREANEASLSVLQ